MHKLGWLLRIGLVVTNAKMTRLSFVHSWRPYLKKAHLRRKQASGQAIFRTVNH